VAAQLGYCGLDRQRRPLSGDEIRACWEAGATAPEPAPTTGARASVVYADDPGDRTPRRLEFVEVRAAPVVVRRRSSRTSKAAPTDEGAADQVAAVPSGPGGPNWSLWGDLET